VKKNVLRLREAIKSLRREDTFIHNFAITFSGNSIAVLVGFLFTPFLARIYTPEAYGSFGVYSAIAQNVSLLATLQLSRAFTLAPSEKELHRIFSIASLSVFIIFVLTLATIIIGFEFLGDFFNITSIGNILYLLPFTMLLFALNDIYRSWNIRYKFFKQNASNQVIASLTSRSTSLAYGIISSGHQAGLIYGDFLSKIVENIHLGRKGALGQVYLIFKKKLNFNLLWGALLNYKNYPMYVLPGAWVAVFATQMPLLFISKYFSPAEAGYFSLSNSLLNLPIAILAGAMAPVFLQKASEVHQTSPEQLPRIVKSLANRLFFTGLIPIMILTVFGDYIFLVVFGEPWVLSGVFASYMGFYFLFQIISNPLLALFRIYKKERMLLYCNLGAVLLNSITLSIGYYFQDIHLSLILFSAGNVIFFLSIIEIVFSLVGVNLIRPTINWLLSGLSAYGLMKVLRVLIDLI
jgi:O-antigen/teichoic acid export membrane protein